MTVENASHMQGGYRRNGKKVTERIDIGKFGKESR